MPVLYYVRVHVCTPVHIHTHTCIHVYIYMYTYLYDFHIHCSHETTWSFPGCAHSSPARCLEVRDLSKSRRSSPPALQKNVASIRHLTRLQGRWGVRVTARVQPTLHSNILETIHFKVCFKDTVKGIKNM